MGFLFGMLVGGMLFGGNGQNHVPPSLNDIPFRCLAAIEQGDAAYMDCRRLSMAAMIYQQYNNTPDWMSGVNRDTLKATVESALAIEIRALHELEAAAKAQQGR